MNYTLRDPNGNVLLSVESTPVVTEADMKADLDKAAKACESAFDEVTKYQDAMAVMSSEGFGEQAKVVASKVWEKIKELLKRIIEFIKEIFVRGGAKIKATKLLKRVEAMDDSEIDTFSTGLGVKFKLSYVPILPLREFTTGISTLVSFIHGMKLTEKVDNGEKNDIFSEQMDKLLKSLPTEIEPLVKGEIDLTTDSEHSKYKTGYLSLLGITDKKTMINYLKGVISEDNALFDILKKIDQSSKDWMNVVNKTTEDSDVIKTCSEVSKVLSKLTKLTWSFINVSLSIIDIVTTKPTGDPTKTMLPLSYQL